jgi:hypothetical protein
MSEDTERLGVAVRRSVGPAAGHRRLWPRGNGESVKRIT